MTPPHATPGDAGVTPERRAALARVAGIAAVFMPTFGVLDLLLVRTLHPEVGLAYPLAIRLGGVAVAVLVYLLTRAPSSSARAVGALHALLLATASVMMAALAARLGGPASPYVHGLTIAFIVRATVVPSSLRESLAHGALLVVVYALGVAAASAILGPEITASWWRPRGVVELLAQGSIVLAVVIGGAVGSRATHEARRELHRARRLGRYRLEAHIGRGGQGEVWLAFDTRRARQVALKILPPHARTPEAQALFEREARLASMLRGEHAVRVFDFGASDDGFAFIAMEYLPGEDLAAVVHTHGPLPPARVIHIGVQACDALAEAHALGLVHRDVKPANLRMTRVGDSYDVVKLIDFGIARSLRAKDGEVTRRIAVRGTPAYMAPEVCRGERPSAAADIYALGATLYHLLAGGPPFVGDDVEIIAGHLGSSAPPLATRAPHVPGDLARVVMRCLEKSPEARFTDVQALRDALSACGDAGRWTQADAARFWEQERVARMQRYEADTAA